MSYAHSYFNMSIKTEFQLFIRAFKDLFNLILVLILDMKTNIHQFLSPFIFPYFKEICVFCDQYPAPCIHQEFCATQPNLTSPPGHNLSNITYK